MPALFIMTVTFELSEVQAIAILAALKKLEPGAVKQLLPETQANLSIAYHRLNGQVCRSLQRGMTPSTFL